MVDQYLNYNFCYLYLSIIILSILHVIEGTPVTSTIIEPETTGNDTKDLQTAAAEILTTLTESTTNSVTGITRPEELTSVPDTSTSIPVTETTTQREIPISTPLTAAPVVNDTTLYDSEQFDRTTTTHHEIQTILQTTQSDSTNKLNSSVPVIKENTIETDGQGGYHYSFVGSDGIIREETGIIKEIPNENNNGSEPTIVSKGSYSYISPLGKTYRANYVADEDGFRVNFTLVSS